MHSFANIASIFLALAQPATQPFDLPKIETKYYDIYSDLDAHGLVDVMDRTTCMARVYRVQTVAYAKAVDGRFPFVLYRHLEDFEAAGGPHGSAGFFDGEKLMAFAGEHADARTWHLLQHEAFHQFAHAAISDHLPIWLDEGLAEFFGEGVFTGDDLSLGLIPDWRRQRVRQSIENKKFLPIDALMQMSPETWNQHITIENYDQVWSLVQFLMHGDNSRWRAPFEAYLKSLSNNATPAQAWTDAFGHALDDLPARWKSWWENLPPDATDDAYARATVATLNSFLARAATERQAFDSFDQFAVAASRHQLQSNIDDVLPSELLAAALLDANRRIAAGATFTITSAPYGKLLETIHCTLPSGARWQGHFKLVDGRATAIRTEQD